MCSKFVYFYFNTSNDIIWERTMEELKEKTSYGSLCQGFSCSEVTSSESSHWSYSEKSLSIISFASRIFKEIHHYIPKTQSFVLYSFTSWNIFDNSPSRSKSEKMSRWKRNFFLRSCIAKLFLEPRRWQRLRIFL